MAYVLNFCKTTMPTITINSTKAQKLLYCCYGAVLAQTNQRLTDEHPKAWLYGPVFPRISDDINKKRLNVGMAEEFKTACPHDVLKLVNQTITTFGKYTATQLTNWSCLMDSPWKKADPLAALDDREIAIFFKAYLPIIKAGENDEPG